MLIQVAVIIAVLMSGHDVDTTDTRLASVVYNRNPTPEAKNIRVCVFVRIVRIDYWVCMIYYWFKIAY